MSLDAILNSLVAAGKLHGNRLCELGKITIGGLGGTQTARSGNQYRAPVKHDHFTITTMQRNEAGDLMPDIELMERLVARYGDRDGKLRRIPIRLLSDDVNEVLQSSYVWYGGKQIGARSDGETVTWFNDAATGKRLPQPVVEPWHNDMLKLKDSKGTTLFKCHTVLSCVIAADYARWGGVYKFRTTSVISFGHLLHSLLHISLKLTNGVLAGLPLELVVQPERVSPDGRPSTVYVVHVELIGKDLLELQRLAVQQAQLRLECRQQMMALDAQYKRLIAAAPGYGETDEEVAAVQEEFHPEEPPPVAPATFAILDQPEATVSAPESPPAAPSPPAGPESPEDEIPF